MNHLPGQLPAPFCSLMASLHFTSTQHISGEPRTPNPLVHHHPLALRTASEASCTSIVGLSFIQYRSHRGSKPLFASSHSFLKISERQIPRLKINMIFFCLVFTVLLTLGAAFANPSRPFVRRGGFSVPVAQARGSKRDFARDWVAAHQKWGAGAPAGIASTFSLAGDGKLCTSCPAQRSQS